MLPLEKFLVTKKTAKDSPLIKNILLKKAYLRKGDPRHKKIKTALVIGGGGMRAVYSAGVTAGFKKSGLTEVFDIVVGISAGSAVSAYFLSDQSDLAISVYQKNLIGKEFINPLRIAKIMDIDYLDHLFRKLNPLNQEKIRKARSELFVTVTNVKTGKGELLSMKDKEVDIIDAIRASSALPVIYNKTVNIKGKEYCDGAMGNGIPIKFLIDKGCTDILVVLNNSAKKKGPTPFFERIASYLYMRKFPKRLRSSLLGRNELYNKSLEQIEKLRGVNVGIMTPPQMPLKRMSKDIFKMNKVSRMAEDQVRQIFRD